MSSKTLNVLLILFHLVSIQNSNASPLKHKISKQTDLQDVTVPLSTSPIEVISKNEEVQNARSVQSETTFEFGANSWSPKNLALKSRLITNSAPTQSIPEMSLRAGTSAATQLRFTGGVNFSNFSRNDASLQVAYVPSIQIGVEYAPVETPRSHFKPYLSFNLKPSLVITNRSLLSDGETEFGVPIEAGIGTYFIFSQTIAFDASVTGTAGKVGDSDFSGIGIGAGMRVTL